MHQMLLLISSAEKIVARAIRAHDLIDIALLCVLTPSVLDLSPPYETIDIIHSGKDSATEASEQDHGHTEFRQQLIFVIHQIKKVRTM